MPENKDIVVKFNDAISSQNLEELTNYLSDDHVFIDSANGQIKGIDGVTNAWKGFFKAFPDYRNIFEDFYVQPEQIVISGHSICSDRRLNGPALWTAKFTGEKIREWRVFDDTDDNRRSLGIEAK